MICYLVGFLETNSLQYNVPTGDAEEDAIASRALHGNKDHKDFANCEGFSID